MVIPLEDNYTDVLGKAQRGLRITDNDLAVKSGLTPVAVKTLREGEFDEAAARKVSPILRLNADALADLALNRWQPPAIELEGISVFNTPFDNITVNSYLIWNPKNGEAIAFDTGSDCSGMIDVVETKRLEIKLILLSHSHGDHVFDLDRLKEKTGASAFISTRESLAGAETFDVGRIFRLGGLRVDTRLTWGHSRGGTTYVVTGLAKPVAVVGDALFASSMGGGMVSYEAALETNRAQIFTLPDETILCPGHGPLTTVAFERKHNPFFA
jgi:glyoxylase-like metal-dependent hydrolase (beta-lactamase superfamily II)